MVSFVWALHFWYLGSYCVPQKGPQYLINGKESYTAVAMDTLVKPISAIQAQQWYTWGGFPVWDVHVETMRSVWLHQIVLKFSDSFKSAITDLGAE